MALMLVGNIWCCLWPPDYWVVAGGDVSFPGLPHGAYFGVASIVAGKLADEGRSSEAVSIMIAGMTVANLFGVPLGTSLSHTLSWRATFLLVGLLGSDSHCTTYGGGYLQVEGLKDTGIQGTVPFPEDSGALADIGSDGFGQWRRVLLV